MLESASFRIICIAYCVDVLGYLSQRADNTAADVFASFQLLQDHVPTFPAREDLGDNGLI